MMISVGGARGGGGGGIDELVFALEKKSGNYLSLLNI